MEERLDDALNVLRNHCEPQLGISLPVLDGNSYVGTSPGGVPPTIQSENQSIDPPIKLERVPINTSKYNYNFKLNIKLLIFNHFQTEKRKEPPDVDSKPSSSVEGSGKGGNSKRARR